MAPMRLSSAVASAWFVLALGTLLLPYDALLHVGILAAALVALFWIVFAGWSLIIAVKSLRRKAWLPSLFSLVLPIALPLAVWQTFPYAQYLADYAHFQAMRAVYDARIAQLPRNGKRYAEFNWGGMLFASKGVTYDETDEVALPAGRQSGAWKKRMKNTDLTCGGDGPVGDVTPLGGHYYMTGFGC